jgi:predicted transcriptional regulator
MTRQQQLEHYLEQLDLTNVALARMAGVAPSSVQRWTAGTIEPPLMLLRLLQCMLLLRQQQDDVSDMLKSWEVADDQPVASA